MFCGKKNRMLRKGIAAFLLLILACSCTAFAEEAPADSEMTVELEGADSRSDEAVEEIEKEKDVVLFSQDSAVTDKTVYIYSRKTIAYESTATHRFSVKCGGKVVVAYCIEPSVEWGGKGRYKAIPFSRELMAKALYYSYGNPGYSRTSAYLKKLNRKSCYKGSDGVYVFCHLMLSYIYDGEKTTGDAFRGCCSGTAKAVKKLVATIKKWPDPPEKVELSLTPDTVEAKWNSSSRMQETPELKLEGTDSCTIDVDVPEGAALVHDGEKTESGKVTVKTGETFSFTAPASVTGTYESPEIEGSEKSFQPYLIRPAGKQDQLFSISTGSNVSFAIDWVKFGDLDVTKVSDNEKVTSGNGYYSLEGAEYEVRSKENRDVFATFVTDKEGNAGIENIPYGDYYIVETDPPRGYRKDSKNRDVTIASSDQEKTLPEAPEVPSIKTKAAEKQTGKKSVNEGGVVIINDTVEYSGLQTGISYRLTGQLMDKAADTPIGNTAAEMTFKPKTENGTVNMEFELDTRNMRGRTVVAFEKLYFGKNLIASHEDINDAGQSVEIIQPGTEDEKSEDSGPDTGDRFAPGIAIALLGACLALGTAVFATKN